jgi:hypothetical protein
VRSRRGLLSVSRPGHLRNVPANEEQTTAPRRWSAFVCPDCRFVFRIPKDHDGEGIVCPSCRRLLKIPGEGEDSAPLMAPLQKIGFAEDDTPDPRGEKRTRSKRKKKEKEAETPGWEASAGKWRASRKKGKRTLQTLGGWTLAIIVVFGVAFFLVKDNEPQETAEKSEKVDDFDELVQVPLLMPDEELEDPIELPKIMQRSEGEFLTLAQPVAEAFMTATSVEQILPWVRDRERVEAKIQAHYREGEIEPMGLSKFNATGRVSYKDTFAAVTILTPNFERKQLAFVDSADGLKIDWESWVGWSEMPWDKLIESRPTQPVLVRAMLKRVDYYNFGFGDEVKWRSYLIVSPDGEHTLYGYAERNSLIDQRLRPDEQNISFSVTLKIRFPEDGDSRNQTVIEEFVSDGWVVPDKAE